MPKWLWQTIAGFLIVGSLAVAGYVYVQLNEAAGQRHATYQYQPADKPSLPVAVPGQPQPRAYQPNCQGPQDQNNSDLCAQWAAVDQITEANRLASTNVRLTLWIVIFTMVGTAGLIMTFVQQRKTSRAELRAYISVVPQGLPKFGVGDKSCAIIRMRNTGATPAYECLQHGVVLIREYPLTSDPMDNIHPVIEGVRAPSTVHGRDESSAFIYGYEAVTKEEWAAIQKGDKVIYLIGNVYYRDTFDRPLRTEFCYFLNIEALRDAEKTRRDLGGGRSEVKLKWAIANMHNKAT
jgi:hypothetical protein